MIKSLGGVTVFEGTGKDISDKEVQYKEVRHRERYPIEHDKIGVYMVRTPARQIWVEVWQPRYVDTNYFLTVVEKQELKPRASLIPAEQMKQTLDAEGHVMIPVLFDTDKTDIKPESAPLMAEVVKLMKQNPSLKLRIEGHTDTQGTPAYNVTLSDGRAKSVMLALLKAGIDSNRLQAKGFGQTRPVAENATEGGRAKNRRVELVKI
jgi:outer membrane protein OmpA-like peptidoglycan-associated protein